MLFVPIMQLAHPLHDHTISTNFLHPPWARALNYGLGTSSVIGVSFPFPFFPNFPIRAGFNLFLSSLLPSPFFFSPPQKTGSPFYQSVNLLVLLKATAVGGQIHRFAPMDSLQLQKVA